MKIHPWAGALRKAVLKGDIPWPFVRKPLGFVSGTVKIDEKAVGFSWVTRGDPTPCHTT